MVNTSFCAAISSSSKKRHARIFENILTAYSKCMIAWKKRNARFYECDTARLSSFISTKRWGNLFLYPNVLFSSVGGFAFLIGGGLPIG
jgi:hypothetical protein